MYTVHKNVQIIIALLKEYEIKNIVVSAGTRHIPFLFSIENDDYFHCYSIVDERSAAFFALGLIQRLQEPVAIICTSGTASCNYLSAVAEAYYQHLPLVVLTSDRNRCYLNQQEDQCLPQKNLYKDLIRRSVDLPIVRDEMDFWYCNRLVNEALLELNHRDKGPVHINFQIDDNYPIEKSLYKYNVPNLPRVIKIDRIMASDSSEKWQQLAKELKGKRILVLWGQHQSINNDESKLVQQFCEQFGALLSSDILGNIHIKNYVSSNWLSRVSNSEFTKIAPEVVITMNGNRLINMHARFNDSLPIDHWHVSLSGEISDPLKRQKKIIEASPLYFFSKMVDSNVVNDVNYYAIWKKLENTLFSDRALSYKFKYSAVSAIQSLINHLPSRCLFHISNSNNIRIANNFPIPSGIDIYCNRGTCGIDGSVSTYIAQSYISMIPSFMIVGDLSFFYDMNAIWNRYTANVRIMLINNKCGALFHSNYYEPFKGSRDVDLYVAAKHNSSVKGWVKSQGFEYMEVHNQEELEHCVDIFTNINISTPMFMEVFTDAEIDVSQINELGNCQMNTLINVNSNIKNSLKAILPDSMVNKLKQIKDNI